MPHLTPPADVSVPAGLSLELSATDQMFEGNHRHYVSVGASAIAAIEKALAYAGAPAPLSILDFGCGAGRVARWLRLKHPRARIFVADMRENDVALCAERFDAVPWIIPKGGDVAALHTDERFDLIWAGSVMTHLSEASTCALFARFVEWLNPGGVAVTSLLGPWGYAKMREGRTYGLVERAVLQALEGYERDGYGYADYPRQNGYGISVSTPAWAINLVEGTPSVTLINYAERGWDNHHDVLSVRRPPG